MDSWVIKIELLSETIFGSGQALPGAVDLEIVHDENGLPYLKGKTLKGKLREEIQAIVDLIKETNPNIDFNKYVVNMFGKEAKEHSVRSNKDDLDKISKIKFSDCKIPKNVQTGIEYGIREGIFDRDEVLRSLTNFRDFTSIDENGVAQTGSLRRYRTIKKGLYFFTELHIEEELAEMERVLLAAGVSTLRHLGSMESRGKGKVKSSLLLNGEDITQMYTEILEKEVARN